MPGRIPPDVIDRIREATDIVDLISEYVRLEKKGANFFGLCPFHPEKTPSFSVHPGKQIFHCFGCGIGGNVFSFLQEHDKLSFAEAARELAHKAGIDIPEEKDDPARSEKFDRLYQANQFACEYFSGCLWKGEGGEFEKVRRYLEERDISQSLAKTFHLGYAPDRWDGLITAFKKQAPKGLELRDFLEAGLLQQKEDRTYDRFRGRLMFPIMNLSGKPIGFGGRTLKDDADVAKYINTQQTLIYNKSQVLYGMHLAREQVRRKGECLIVEGYTDLMRLHEGGFTNSVATSGTALTADQARILRRFCPRVTLIFDGDAAGSHAALRGGDVLLGAGLDARVVGLPENYDPDGFLRDRSPGALASLLEQAQDMIHYRIELYRREGRLMDVPSRADVARELLSTLAVIPDPIRKELTTRDAAGQIGIAAETLLRELNRFRGAPARDTEVQAEGKDLFAAFPVKERGLVEALIRWPELRAPAFTEISSEDVKNKILHRIVARMEEAGTKGEELTGVMLIADDTPREDASFISYALSQTESLSEPGIDPKVKRRYDDFITAHDCLKYLAAFRLEQAERKLKSDLVAKTDIKEVLQTQRKIKEIIDRKKALKSKKFFELPPHPSADVPDEQLHEMVTRVSKGR